MLGQKDRVPGSRAGSQICIKTLEGNEGWRSPKGARIISALTSVGKE